MCVCACVAVCNNVKCGGGTGGKKCAQHRWRTGVTDCVCLYTVMFMSDTVQREEVNVMCVFMCKCVQTSHKHTRVSESMDEICHLPASPGLVCTHCDAQMFLKHFLNRRRWLIFMIQTADYEAALHIATPNPLPSPFAFNRCKPSSGPTTLTQ